MKYLRQHTHRLPPLRAAVLLVLLSAVGAARAEVDPAVLQAEAERVAAVERASSAALAIFAANGQGGGSGVVISADGYALSNFHVTREAGEAMKCGMADGKLYDAVIVGIDPTGDLAMLKLLGRDDFPCATLADSDQVEVGDWCFAIGNPFLLATDFRPTVSYGVISGVHRYQYPDGTLLEYADCLQADAAINPGNSGGPLFDAQARVIGINGRGSFEKRGRVNVGVGYAISSNQIKNFVGYLKSGRVVDHATLGARVVRGDANRVVVDEILEESDAFRRGLRYGDEILSFGGRKIATVNAFKNILGIFPKGWRVPLTFRNKEEIVETLVRLRGVHGETELESLLTNGRRAERQPKDKPKKERPTPLPKPRRNPKPAMPEVVKAHFIARPGYVNYYFNQVEQDRIWKGLVAHGDFTSLAGSWSLDGESATGGDVRFELSDDVAMIRSPGGQLQVDLMEQLNGKLDPPGSGGLLVALAMWRRLLVQSPAKFGDVHYVGTAPLAGHEGTLDVLSATHAGVETRFIVDPANGQLVALEMFPDEDEDPCEVSFGDYRQIDGRSIPHRIEVRTGESVYMVFNLQRVAFAPAAEK